MDFLPRAIADAADAHAYLASPAAAALAHRLQTIEAQGLVLLVEPVEPAAPAPPLARVAADLAALHAALALVPLRAGEPPTDADHARRYLTARHDHLRTLLATIAGCDEWAIHFSVPAPTASPSDTAQPSSAPSGAGYLQARRHHYDHRDGLTATTRAAAQHLLASLGPIAHAAVLSPARSRAAPPQAELALLVPRAAISELRLRFEACDHRRDCAATLTGPWPAQRYASACPASAAQLVSTL